MGYIYCLKHPITNEIRYIGKTTSTLENRLQRHISQRNIGKTHIKSWIKSLINKGLSPIIEEIEKCNDLDSKEIYWISYYSDKVNLCNIAKGGQGGGKCSKYAKMIEKKIKKSD